MTIDIPSEYEDILRQAVANGAFANPELALRHALELFAADQADSERSKRNRWNERNQLAMEQSAGGLSQPLDDLEIFQKSLEKLIRAKLPDRLIA